MARSPQHDRFARRGGSLSVQWHGHYQAYTQAMQACGRAKKWRQARELLERMRQAPGVRLDAFAYNAALSACGRAQQINPMLSLLRQMSSDGISPDRVSYTIAMDSCARSGMTSEALHLFNSMGKGGVPEPDAVCYSAAIAACARPTVSAPSAWKDALRILSQMANRTRGGPGATIRAVSGAMAAATNAREHGVCLSLYDRLETNFGLQPDAIACSTAIAACSRSGQYGRALRVFRSMRSRLGLRRDAVCYNTLLHACAVLSRRSLGARHALRLRRLMQAEGVKADDVTYSVLLQSLWHSEVATEIMDDAMQRTEAGSGESHAQTSRQVKEGAFTRCLKVLSHSGEAKGAGGGGGSVDDEGATLRVMAEEGAAEAAEQWLGDDGLGDNSLADGESWTVDLHELSPGAAVAMVLWTLSQVAKREVLGTSHPTLTPPRVDRRGIGTPVVPIPRRVAFITGWGRHASSYQFIGRQRGAVRGQC